MSTVIVFGPTGSVASVVARTAADKGAKVVLAMRDPSKSIPGLSKEDEQKGGFTRVQADLTKPDTVSEAVKSAGAKRAFIYLAFGGNDHMKSTLEALKSAGIEFVVFLSSFTVPGEPEEANDPKEMISFMHAKVEVSLDEVYGRDNYVALRPGGFATNLLRFTDGVKSGDLKLYGPEFTFDCITPWDMGRVGGTILVSGPKNNQQRVYLYGPKHITQEQGLRQVGEILGKDIKVTPLGPEEGMKQFLDAGVPPPVAEFLVRKMEEFKAGKAEEKPNYEEGVENVKLYTGTPAQEFEDWARNNKQLFT